MQKVDAVDLCRHPLSTIYVFGDSRFLIKAASSKCGALISKVSVVDDQRFFSSRARAETTLRDDLPDSFSFFCLKASFACCSRLSLCAFSCSLACRDVRKASREKPYTRPVARRPQRATYSIESICNLFVVERVIKQTLYRFGYALLPMMVSPDCLFSFSSFFCLELFRFSLIQRERATDDYLTNNKRLTTMINHVI